MKFYGHFPLEDQVVLITGGSQGLGKQFAYKYYNETERTKIILVSRSNDKLYTVVKDIESSHVQLQNGTNDNEPICLLNDHPDWFLTDRRIFYLPCDLSNFNEVDKMFGVLLDCHLYPTVILNCVGGSIPKLFKELTPNELELGIDQNYKSVLTLSHTLLNRFKQLSNSHKVYNNITTTTTRTTGTRTETTYKCHLVLFSSEVCFFPFIGYSQYAPLKVAMKSLINILRQEIYSPEFNGNITLSCVYPGNFKSEGFELEELTKPKITKIIEGPSYPISCVECCNKIIYWLDMGYNDVTTDFVGWILMAVDMGLNKNNNKSFLYWLQLLIGGLANLIIVPIYTIICQWQIKSYFSESNKNGNTTQKQE